MKREGSDDLKRNAVVLGVGYYDLYRNAVLGDFWDPSESFPRAAFELAT